MKSRLSLIFAALVIILGALIWMALDRNTPVPAPALAAAPAISHAPTVVAQAQTLPEQPTPPSSAPAVPTTNVAAPAPEAKALPVMHIDAAGDSQYVARAGDTVSELAIALLGSDSKEHRDTVIAANATLQSNPDLVLEGQTYSISQQLATEVEASAKPASVNESAGANLKYSARPGDTVHGLAANLLGGDTKVNRDAIISGNASLQNNPDHLVVGQSYKIPASNGLAANANAAQAKAPTSQPDSDDILRVGLDRTLRYTAKSGDTVSKLAVALMGSDTPANRDLIIKNNPSLKLDPDHLTAGKTYWIAAPSADAKP